jgi:hypothetical protein
MSTKSTAQRIAEGVVPLTEAATAAPANSLILAHIWVAVIAFGSPQPWP